jgi:hypothetical protein
VSNVLFDVVIDVPAPRVDPKGIFVCEETTLTSLDVLRVCRRVHVRDYTRGEFSHVIHTLNVPLDALNLILGRAFQKAFGSHKRIQLEIVRVELGCMTREHARHDRRPCESIEYTDLIVAENFDNRTFDEIE